MLGFTRLAREEKFDFVKAKSCVGPPKHRAGAEVGERKRLQGENGTAWRIAVGFPSTGYKCLELGLVNVDLRGALNSLS